MRCQVVLSLAGSCRTARGKWARATPVLVVQNVGSRPTRPSRVRRSDSRCSGAAASGGWSGAGVGASSLASATGSPPASTGGSGGTRSGGRGHGSGNGGKYDGRSRSGIYEDALNQIHTGRVKQQRLERFGRADPPPGGAVARCAGGARGLGLKLCLRGEVPVQILRFDLGQFAGVD